MNELTSFALLAITSFFTLINPLGVMPIFMTMTADLDQEHKIRTAQKASIVLELLVELYSSLWVWICFKQDLKKLKSKNQK